MRMYPIWKLEWHNIDDEKLRELLETGETEIDISEIEIESNVLKYKGKKIIIEVV